MTTSEASCLQTFLPCLSGMVTPRPDKPDKIVPDRARSKKSLQKRKNLGTESPSGRILSGFGVTIPLSGRNLKCFI